MDVENIKYCSLNIQNNHLGYLKKTINVKL